jgi:hypothetical protein
MRCVYTDWSGGTREVHAGGHRQLNWSRHWKKPFQDKTSPKSLFNERRGVTPFFQGGQKSWRGCRGIASGRRTGTGGCSARRGLARVKGGAAALVLSTPLSRSRRALSPFRWSPNIILCRASTTLPAKPRQAPLALPAHDQRAASRTANVAGGTHRPVERTLCALAKIQ